MKTRKLLFLLPFIITLTLIISISAYSKSIFLPGNTRLMEPLMADILEVRFDYIILDQNRINASIGTNIPFIQWELRSQNLYAKKIQFGIFGLTFNRLFNKGNFSFNLDTNDSKFGSYIDFQKGLSVLSLNYTHLSTHLNEGLFEHPEKMTGISTTRYSREYIQLIGDTRFYWLRLYLGGSVTVSVSSPDNLENKFLSAIKWGTEITINIDETYQPFIAVDFSTNQELDFYINTGVSFGIMARGTSKRKIGFQFIYFNGYDPRGNFYNKKTEFFGGGVAFYI